MSRNANQLIICSRRSVVMFVHDNYATITADAELVFLSVVCL